MARRTVENDDVSNGRQTAKYRSIVNALEKNIVNEEMRESVPCLMVKIDAFVDVSASKPLS